MQSAGLGNFGGTMPFTGANQNQSAQNRTMIGGSINGQDTSRMMSPTNAGSTGMFFFLIFFDGEQGADCFLSHRNLTLTR
jgi:hypothetical protein